MTHPDANGDVEREQNRFERWLQQRGDVLCINCKYFGPALIGLRNCEHPGLPVNLVNGTHKFPAIIARGYPALCGPLGIFWEKR